MLRIPRIYRELWTLARDQGWDIEMSGGHHLCWISPTGVKVHSPSSTVSKRGLLNMKAKLRHAGLKGMR